MLVVLVALLLPGVAAALASRPFEPHPSLARLRGLVTGMAAIAGGMLLLSLSQTWWVVEDWEREATLTTRGDSGVVLITVGIGLLSSVLTVVAVRGRRNWAPLGLTMAWLLVGICWFASTGEFDDSDASGEAELGLRLATWSMLLVTITAVLGSLGRLAERRAREAQPARPEGSVDVRAVGTHVGLDTRPGPPPAHPTPAITGWDVAAATAIAIAAVGTLVGIGPLWVRLAFPLAALVVIGVRASRLAATNRAPRTPTSAPE